MTLATVIDFKESFPHLHNAPIAEAIIEVRTQATIDWQESSVSSKIQKSAPNYPHISPVKIVQHELNIESGLEPKQKNYSLGWRGLRCETNNKLQVAQFYRDSFVFSRLHPYDNWKSFHDDALGLWNTHQTIACPEQIDRLGLRFINRIRVPQCDFELGDYLCSSPQPPHETEYPIASFLHQETFQIIGHPYEVSLIKTIQEADGTWLILDIDVFTTSLPSIGSMDMSQLLKEMRWLKNKFFFNSLTKKAWEEMQ